MRGICGWWRASAGIRVTIKWCAETPFGTSSLALLPEHGGGLLENETFKPTLKDAIRLTAPGQPLRTALDMIIAGHLGALICVGDSEHVLNAGNDGFPLNISFTSNRLFELSKMDGAIVIDGDLTQILRANFHLNPDPSLATSETGMRHRTAARMSILTDAIVISVSERRAVVNVYVHGKSYQIEPIPSWVR